MWADYFDNQIGSTSIQPFFGSKWEVFQHRLVANAPYRESATSLVMKRVKYNKQEASRKMGWMRNLDLKMLEAEV
jgi:hypothetical protein